MSAGACSGTTCELGADFFRKGMAMPQDSDSPTRAFEPGSVRPSISHESRRLESYFDDPTPLSAILRDVKGQWRRMRLRTTALRCSKARFPPPESYFASALPPEDLKILTHWEPAFLLGERLRNLRRRETEVARIVFNAAPCDVISIRARREHGRWMYRVLDESGFFYALPQRSSRRPFVESKLVQFIDGIQPRIPMRHQSFVEACILTRGGDPSQVTVESELYPFLQTFYAERLGHWWRRRAEEEL